MVEAMGIKSLKGDGNNVFEVYDQVKKAMRYINNESKPFFLEFDTYRWREHCGPNYDNDLGYRTEEEFMEWKKKDPIPFASNILLKEKVLLPGDLEEISQDAFKLADNAFEYAEESSFPSQEAAYEDIYSP
jgi:pyruvate dehydrogenase E1 component alpha subunit